MGRYYSGDIEGKFWFGVQSSDDADFFGVTGDTPNYLEYYYSNYDIPEVKKGIKECLKELGDNKDKLDKFFEANNGYNNDMLLKEGLDPNLLEWYARLDLGEKILECLVEKGECVFQAEI